ncbi:MAG TPA: bifunctional riboflavin kinase/FAD synthetase [Bryobacteraceae bacterium]|nr:bifunctional riboflavin kinase/FAD synthetase [Bryobacteraceae bacterium]
MTIFRSPAEVPASFGPSAVTIGNFDGVHAGHRQIMRQLKSPGLTPVVLTFDPHPAKVLAPDRAPKLLMTMAQRLRAFESEGIQAVLLLPFSTDLAALTPEEFVRQVLVGTLKARLVLVGEDFRFGHKQAGNIDTLRTLGRQYGFEVSPIAPIEQRHERISSSRVRKLVTEGAVSRACRMLGAPFALEGEVVKGQGIGSKQTVPTLNLAPRNETLPKSGVYVTRTRDIDSTREWPSITNVGYRPTFNGKELTIETFLLGPFDGSSPQKIEVKFLAFVRDERKFDTPEDLKKQILRDASVAIRLHRRLSGLGMY